MTVLKYRRSMRTLELAEIMLSKLEGKSIVLHAEAHVRYQVPVDYIIQTVSMISKVALDDMKKEGRLKQRESDARDIAIALTLLFNPRYSHRTLGQRFNRTHNTCYKAEKGVQGLRRSNPWYKKVYDTSLNIISLYQNKINQSKMDAFTQLNSLKLKSAQLQEELQYGGQAPDSPEHKATQAQLIEINQDIEKIETEISTHTKRLNELLNKSQEHVEGTFKYPAQQFDL